MFQLSNFSLNLDAWPVYCGNDRPFITSHKNFNRPEGDTLLWRSGMHLYQNLKYGLLAAYQNHMDLIYTAAWLDILPLHGLSHRLASFKEIHTWAQSFQQFLKRHLERINVRCTCTYAHPLKIGTNPKQSITPPTITNL